MSDPKHFANVGYPRRGEVAGRSKIDSLCEASVANQATGMGRKRPDQ